MRALPRLLCNFHWIVPGEAARAAQIFSGLLGPFLVANGIHSVINLRGRHPEFAWWRRETQVCRKNAVAHFDAMLDSRQLPTRDMLAALLQAFDAAPRPLMIKCSGGQDRTSLAAALYLIERQGWGAMPAELVQFSRLPYLHLPKPQQRWLRQFLFYAQENAAGLSLGGWIATGYQPEAFAAWLDARSLRHSYSKLYGAPR